MIDPTPPPEPTLSELRSRASELDIVGRSKMTAEELTTAILEAEDPAARADQPTPDHIVGRPPALQLAEQSAAEREATMRVIGEAPPNPDAGAGADADATEEV